MAKQESLERLADQLDAAHGHIGSTTIAEGSDDAGSVIRSMWAARKDIAACLRERAPTMPDDPEQDCWWLPCSIAALIAGLVLGAVFL